MLVVGSVVTVLSLVIGGAYVQASLTGQNDANETAGDQADDEIQDFDTGPDDPEPPPALSQGSSAVTEVPLPVPDSGATFTVFCPTGDGTANSNTCRVRSHNDFSAPVRLSCENTPPGISCAFSPSSVTAPANERATFVLQIRVADDVGPGGHVFDVVGRSGDLTRSYRYPFTLPAPPLDLPPGQEVSPPPATAGGASTPAEPTFTIACSLQSGPDTVIDKLLWAASGGSQSKIKCIVKPINGFDEEVTLELTNVSGDLTSYRFDPPAIRPTATSSNLEGPTVGGSHFVDLTVELGDLEDGAEYSFDVTGVSESVTTSRRVVLTVTDQE
ncbi:MAG: hypothetical protein WD602_03425 [Actinomycetota bacterium]